MDFEKSNECINFLIPYVENFIYKNLYSKCIDLSVFLTPFNAIDVLGIKKSDGRCFQFSITFETTENNIIMKVFNGLPFKSKVIYYESFTVLSDVFLFLENRLDKLINYCLSDYQIAL